MQQRSLKRAAGSTLRVALMLMCATGATGATGAAGAMGATSATNVASATAQQRTQAQQTGPEYARGKALYEARCDLCHDRSVHRRESRSAKSFGDIRSFVVRWDRELGAIWRGEEIDAVARYLNERFYHYPCPAAVCAAQRASAGASRPQGSRAF
ncbi:MAG: hypothetical protein KJZ83_21945 [Burkholderiaceae bacterium]|nr:hypothetical protein [Burkholderiaceae bacterium]